MMHIYRLVGLGLTLSPLALFQACQEDKDPVSPSLTLDASLGDSSTPSADASGGDGSATDTGTPGDTGTSDSGAVDAGPDTNLGYTPCDRPVDAGDGGCPWIKVESCDDSGTDFHDFCGATRRPAGALRCNDDPATEAEMMGFGGPDGSYYNYTVQRCSDEGCPTAPFNVSWRCIECCPK